MESKLRHLRDENMRMKVLLSEIVEQYGDRPHYGEGLFTADYQPVLIRRAMRIIGEKSFITEVPE